MLSEYITRLAVVSFRIVGLHVRAVSVFGKKNDAVCGFLAYFCAVLRFSDPPYAPVPSIMYTDEMFRFLLISLAMLVLYGSMYETQGC